MPETKSGPSLSGGRENPTGSPRYPHPLFRLYHLRPLLLHALLRVFILSLEFFLIALLHPPSQVCYQVLEESLIVPFRTLSFPYYLVWAERTTWISSMPLTFHLNDRPCPWAYLWRPIKPRTVWAETPCGVSSNATHWISLSKPKPNPDDL